MMLCDPFGTCEHVLLSLSDTSGMNFHVLVSLSHECFSEVIVDTEKMKDYFNL